MELRNKTIAFLGDSITEGVGTSAPEKRFAEIIAARTGATALNYGISGTRIARQIKPTVDKPRHDLDFCMRAHEIDKGSDIIVVFGGTNDFGHGDAPFGEFGDRDCSTFCGAVYELLETLLSEHPQAETIFVTPLHRLTEDIPCEANNRVLRDYVDMIRRTCEYFSVPVLDLFSCGRMQPAVDAIREKYMPDGLHPSDAGNEILADRIEHFLKNL